MASLKLKAHDLIADLTAVSACLRNIILTNQAGIF